MVLATSLSATLLSSTLSLQNDICLLPLLHGIPSGLASGRQEERTVISRFLPLGLALAEAAFLHWTLWPSYSCWFWRWLLPAAFHTQGVVNPGLFHHLYFFVSFLLNSYFLFVCFASMYIYAVHTSLMSMETRVGTRSPGIVVTGACELSCRCWELNPSHPEEKPVLLATDPSHQPLLFASYTPTYLATVLLLWRDIMTIATLIMKNI